MALNKDCINYIIKNVNYFPRYQFGVRQFKYEYDDEMDLLNDTDLDLIQWKQRYLLELFPFGVYFSFKNAEKAIHHQSPIFGKEYEIVKIDTFRDRWSNCFEMETTHVTSLFIVTDSTIQLCVDEILKIPKSQVGSILRKEGGGHHSTWYEMLLLKSICFPKGHPFFERLVNRLMETLKYNGTFEQFLKEIK